MDPAIVFLFLFPPLFVATWFLSLHFIAAVGGWRELARVYAATGPIAAVAEWRNRGARLGFATKYNGCVNIAVSSMGMQLSLWRILRIGHPPLFIPWSDIRTEPVRRMFADYVRFSFARAAPTLLLRSALAEEVLRASHRIASAPRP